MQHVQGIELTGMALPLQQLPLPGALLEPLSTPHQLTSLMLLQYWRCCQTLAPVTLPYLTAPAYAQPSSISRLAVAFSASYVKDLP